MKPGKAPHTARTRYLFIVVAACLLSGALIGVAIVGTPTMAPVRSRLLFVSFEEYERRARSQFYREHPGEKPLNWAIARTACRMSESRCMGPFSLHENDCSDFVNCVVDEALGYGPRFERDGDHTGSRISRIWYWFKWNGAEPLLPGDIVSVRHSPWYPPDPDACSHVGVIGADSRVYDWTKLVSWNEPRYNRVATSKFVRNCRVPGEVRVRRLHPKYRYGLASVPRAVSFSN